MNKCFLNGVVFIFLVWSNTLFAFQEFTEIEFSRFIYMRGRASKACLEKVSLFLLRFAGSERKKNAELLKRKKQFLSRIWLHYNGLFTIKLKLLF